MIAVVSVKELSLFKDPADRKLKSIARSTFSVPKAQYHPLLATMLLSEAVMVWSQDLRRGLEDFQVFSYYVVLGDQVASALQFNCHASFDAAYISLRLSASAIVCRPGLLRNCLHTHLKVVTCLG